MTQPASFRQIVSGRVCSECACSKPWWSEEHRDEWDVEKDGNIVRLMLDEYCSPVFQADGMAGTVCSLPISESLMLALERWAHDYTYVGDMLGLSSLVFEYNPAFPMDWFNARGDALADALRAELGQGWWVEHQPLKRDYRKPQRSPTLVGKP